MEWVPAVGRGPAREPCKRPALLAVPRQVILCRAAALRSRRDEAEGPPSAMTRASTVWATRPRTCLPAPRTGAALPPATTAAPACSSPPLSWRLRAPIFPRTAERRYKGRLDTLRCTGPRHDTHCATSGNALGQSSSTAASARCLQLATLAPLSGSTAPPVSSAVGFGGTSGDGLVFGPWCDRALSLAAPAAAQNVDELTAELAATDAEGADVEGLIGVEPVKPDGRLVATWR